MKNEPLSECPFRIGDKVKVISPMLKKEWEDSPAYIVGINLKGDNFDCFDFTLREIGCRGLTDGWGIHDIKCIERTEPPIPSSLVELHSAAHALIGYCESLEPGTVITAGYVERMKDWYVKNLITAMGDASARKDEEAKGESLDTVETSPANIPSEISAIADHIQDATNEFNGGYDNPVIGRKLAEFMAAKITNEPVSVSLEKCARIWCEEEGYGDPEFIPGGVGSKPQWTEFSERLKIILDKAGVKYHE
jgi:hypothetical protein